MMTTSCGWVDLDPDLLALRQAALDQVLIIQPEIQEPHTAVYPFQNEVRSLVDSFLAKNDDLALRPEVPVRAIRLFAGYTLCPSSGRAILIPLFTNTHQFVAACRQQPSSPISTGQEEPWEPCRALRLPLYGGIRVDSGSILFVHLELPPLLVNGIKEES
jgi:hypothetical protein